ncbi:hypothetical protein V5799_029318 [Amblyomma americanum]|uniref:sn-1-specific diacylglycerol lipase ABHD11 n=1 Tax=Amblyomma americanum TaxID=6943 RepID=A0AAQ4ERI1_AMBAM
MFLKKGKKMIVFISPLPTEIYTQHLCDRRCPVLRDCSACRLHRAPPGAAKSCSEVGDGRFAEEDSGGAGLDMLAPACSAGPLPCVSPKPCEASASLSKSVPLAYTLYEPRNATLSEAPPIIVLDGLFGNRDNWRELSEGMARLTGRKVYAVDARNHGDSPHTPDLDYALMAADVEQFMREQSLPRAAFIGHSMGGRTAMQLAFYAVSITASPLRHDFLKWNSYMAKARSGRQYILYLV